MESNNMSPSNEEFKAFKKQSRKALWEEGAKDSALLKDIADVESVFSTADTEGLLDDQQVEKDNKNKKTK